MLRIMNEAPRSIMPEGISLRPGAYLLKVSCGSEQPFLVWQKLICFSIYTALIFLPMRL